MPSPSFSDYEFLEESGLLHLEADELDGLIQQGSSYLHILSGKPWGGEVCLGFFTQSQVAQTWPGLWVLLFFLSLNPLDSVLRSSEGHCFLHTQKSNSLLSKAISSLSL